jgi:uncharacterized membrane protein YgdD (TMEM256/DUF423 family)
MDMPRSLPPLNSQALWTAVGALNGALAVGAGAFGAHALKARLTPDRLSVFETGARYHLSHALALVALGAWASHRPAQTALTVSAWGFASGMVLFSGSLYILALSGIRAFGAVTPLGGVSWMVAWTLWALAALRPSH